MTGFVASATGASCDVKITRCSTVGASGSGASTGSGGVDRVQPDFNTFSFWSIDPWFVLSSVMERRASITSITSNVTARLSSSTVVLSPLINLERFVYRFGALLKENPGREKVQQVRRAFGESVRCTREVP